MTQTTKDQHTVPNCYLKSFGDYFFIFNKETKIWKKKHRKNISTIEYWYEHPKYRLNEVENYLSNIENNWSKLGRDKLLENLKNNDYSLTSEDKEITAQFIWTLINRTEYGYEQINQFNSQLNDWLLKNNATSELIKENSSVDSKEINLELIQNNISELTNNFYWIVLKTSDSVHKFFISDNPILRNGSHLENNYAINFILSPTISIQLIQKHNKNTPYKVIENKIKLGNYKDILYFNKCQIRDSYKYIYVSDEKQQLFINKIFTARPEFLNIDRNRTKITEFYENNKKEPSILAFGINKPNIKR
jgi:Protein of unknown function (DUF4238)